MKMLTTVFCIVAFAMTSTLHADRVDVLTSTKQVDITASGYSGNTALTNFPVLVKLGTGISGFSYADMANPQTGADLRFTDAGAARELNYEIDTWNPTGMSYVWVQVPSLATNTVIKAWYGNTNLTTFPAYAADGSTWSNGYVAVYHLGESSGTLGDSSPQSNTLTAYNNIQMGATGIVGSAPRWPDAVNDYLQAPDNDSLDGMDALTLECWMYDEQNDTQPRGLISKRTASGIQASYFFYKTTGYRLQFVVGGTSVELTGSETAANRWYHAAATFDKNLPSARVKGYLDGVLKISAPGTSVSVPITTSPLHIGNLNAGYTACWKGNLDEVRISNTARSADWLKATHDNSKTATAFLHYGTVTNVVPVSPLVSVLPASAITGTGATLNGRLAAKGEDYGEGEGPEILFAWGANPAALANTNSIGTVTAVGAVSYGCSGLDYATTYYYQVLAANGGGEIEAVSSMGSVATIGNPIFGTVSHALDLRQATLEASLSSLGLDKAVLSCWLGTSAGSLAKIAEWTGASVNTEYSTTTNMPTLGGTYYYAFKADASVNDDSLTFTTWSTTNAFTLSGTTTWTGAGDGRWTTDANWDLGAPGAGADALASTAAAVITDEGNAIACKNLTATQNASLRFDVETTLDAASITANAASLTIDNGTVNLSGAITLGSSAGSYLWLTNASVSAESLTVSGLGSRPVICKDASLTIRGTTSINTGNTAADSHVHVMTGGILTMTTLNMGANSCQLNIDGGVVTNTGSIALPYDISHGYNNGRIIVKNGGRMRVGGSMDMGKRAATYLDVLAGGEFSCAGTIKLGTGTDAYYQTSKVTLSNAMLSVGSSLMLNGDLRCKAPQYLDIYEDLPNASRLVVGTLTLGNGTQLGGNPGGYGNRVKLYGGEISATTIVLGGSTAAATNNVLEITGATSKITTGAFTARNFAVMLFTVPAGGFDDDVIAASGTATLEGTTKLTVNATAWKQGGVVTFLQANTLNNAMPEANTTVTVYPGSTYRWIDDAHALKLSITPSATLLTIR